MTTHIRWGHVLDQARDIVDSYDTAVTLRQLFYRLVALGIIPSTLTAYKRLSSVTAAARRDGGFPDLTDRGRGIEEYRTFASPSDALRFTAETYRRDRTEGQGVSLYLGVEKAGIVNQLDARFGDPLGLPILPLGGYASQSFVDDVAAHVEAAGRPAVLLYGGDHNPSGWDTPRDFETRTGCFRKVIRVAVTPGQIDEYDLPATIDEVKDESDSRSKAFIARFGRRRVDLDALDPDVLRGLFAAAIAGFWDTSTFEASLAQERLDIETLRGLL